MAQRNAASQISSGTFVSSLEAQYSIPSFAVRQLAQDVILRVAAQARAERVEATLPKIAMLTKDLLSQDDCAARNFVCDARLQGMPADTLYYGLLAGAVQDIGKAWDNDEIGMSEVLRASRRVWTILRDLREVFVQFGNAIPGQRVAIAQCPSETHSIGMTIVADDLRRRGWEVDLLIGYDQDSLVDQLEALSPSAVAIAATDADMTLPIARLVVALRAHLPGVWLMVGGQVTVAEPNIVALTGADAMANSADEAERLLLAHMADRTERRANRA
ncbi:MAG: cobalamin B12-binding domain-containing protein [Rhodobacteraceae bacterium]|nr:cobalamin B12-binding domain-containing protein [Paracoccaceae bacterium]